MRKFVILLFAFLVMMSSMHAAMVRPLPVQAQTEQTSMGTAAWNHMSVKEFQQCTGRKLNLTQRLAFKALQKVQNAAAEGKSQLVALLLAWFVGILGIHRFYLGYTWQGIIQLITFGGLGIWALVDIIRIATGDLKPKNGEYGEKL